MMNETSNLKSHTNLYIYGLIKTTSITIKILEMKATNYAHILFVIYSF